MELVTTKLPKPTAPGIVLALLCLMYGITYIDRVNVGTAAPLIKADLGLTNTQLGLIFSGFAYPYALLQIYGGWVSDRFGPRKTLFACGFIWAAATILTGLAGGIFTLFLARLLLGLGEGATFPGATRAMQSWVKRERRGFAQGITHACARLGNAVTPPLVAWLAIVLTWRGSFVVLGCLSLTWIAVWFWFYRDDPADHKLITEADLAVLPPYVSHHDQTRPNVPWKRLAARMLPVTIVYFCYGWTLWLFLNWLPSFFLHNYNMKLGASAIFASGVFFAGVIGDTLGGVLSDLIYRRTGNLLQARRNVIACGFLGALVFLIPMFFTRDLAIVSICLSAAFCCSELVIGPIWAIPMDIAPQFSGTAAGLMNTGSAVAAILSPLTFGVIIDLTGNWELPFIGSVGLLALGLVLSFTMHPEIPFDATPMKRLRVATAE